MALVLADRVKETTTTTGTGTFTLAGAVTGFESFASIGNGNTTYYCCVLGSDFEVGIGTYTSSGTTLARTTILQSSNSDNAVNWGAGTKTLFCTQPAEKAVYLDASGNIEAFNASNLTAINASNVSSGTLSEDRLPSGGAGAATYGSTSNGTKIDTITLDAKGRVTAVATGTTGDITNVSVGTGLDGGGSSGSISISLDLSEFTDMTATMVGTDEFIVLDNGAERRKAASEIPLSILNNDSSFIDGSSLNASNLSSGTVPNARLDAQLQDVAGLAVTNGNFIVGDGSNFVAESGATARTSLGLGTAATLDTGISNTNVPKFTSGVADNDFLKVAGTAIEGRSASEVLSDIGGITASSTDTLTNKTLTTPVINGFSGTGNGSITGDLTLTSTDAGATEDPTLDLYRNSASPANNDVLGHIKFNGENDAGEKITYAEIQTSISDASDGTEGARLQLGARYAGTFLTYYEAKFGLNTFNRDAIFTNDTNIIFEGATNDGNETTLTVADPTADRTVTLPNASGTVQLTDGSGASLTSLNASQLSSGTVPNARLDAQLQDVAGLAVTNGNFIVGDGSNFVAESGSTARTSLGLGTAAVLNTGISNTNVPKFTSGVADNDFLRVDGTAIEGRSASEVLSDIGGQASLTFGISNTNAVKVDSTSVADDEYARFTANGLESRSTSEVLSDIGGISASSTSTLTNKTLTTPVINGFSGTGNGSIIGDLTLTSTDGGSAQDPTLNLFRNSASPADGDVLGHINFSGEDSAGNQTVYAKIEADIADVTNGTEDGRLDIGVVSAGTFSNRITLQGNGVTRFSNKDVELSNGVSLRFEGATGDAHETSISATDPTQDNTLTLPNISGTFITTGNSDTPTTTTSSGDADFVLVDDGGTMKKITPSNLGITSGGTTAAFATAMAMVL